MDYIKEYKSFVTSYYFAEGWRITIGITLPAIVLNYFGLLPVGLVVALGAMCTSVSDLPGPALARRNGMLATIIINFFLAVITAALVPHPLGLGILLVAGCFVFSMIGVYGARMNSIGVSALLIMVLTLYRVNTGWQIPINAAYVAAGGLWYMIFSLAIYSFRPYRLVQQALGDSIFAIADYLRSRAGFYEKDADYEKVYLDVMEQQSDVQHKQLLVRELLFKSRNIVKESTLTGRTLLMIFTETVDLFEQTTTSFHSYEGLHASFDDTDILKRFQAYIYQVATEMELNGLAVQSGKRSRVPDQLNRSLQTLQGEFRAFSDNQRSPGTFEALISLKRIMQSLEDITRRIYTLHNYTRYEVVQVKEAQAPLDYDQFVSRTDLDPKHVLDNLTMQSNTLRHAIRLSIAVAAGYLISHIITLGHSYWILLTIIVILKPAYSVSRTRNYQRTMGTVAGALIGFAILLLIRDKHVLFFIMLLLMTATYSLIRIQYLLAVVFMTPYIFIMFYLLGNQDYDKVILDRLLDTGIGSVIAFAVSFLLVPSWEHQQIRTYMADALKGSLDYYRSVAGAFAGRAVSMQDFKLTRKNAFVSLGNLSEAFSRMLSEPKSKQKDARNMHQFVVMLTMMNSHIATLSHLSTQFAMKYKSVEFEDLIGTTEEELDHARSLVMRIPLNDDQHEEHHSVLPARINDLVNQRKLELQQGLIETETRVTLSEFKPIVDQFLFISGISADLEKLCGKLGAAEAMKA